MKYFLYSNAPGMEFEEQVDSLDYADLQDCVETIFGDEIEKAMAGGDNPFFDKPQGYFLNTEQIDEELYSYAKSYLQRHLGGKIFAKTIDDAGTVVSNQAINLASEIVDQRRYREQSYVDVGAVIISMLANFLREGSWQFGLRREDGTILAAPSQWPAPATTDDRVHWQDQAGQLEPLIWFGLQGEPPIECWVLDRSPAQSEQLAVYDNPYAKERSIVERWNNFWFCRFWTLDWNTLFGNNGDNYIVWMFAECGMEEPVDEFHAVRDSCPVPLNEDDSCETLFRKIEEFFLATQRGSCQETLE